MCRSLAKVLVAGATRSQARKQLMLRLTESHGHITVSSTLDPCDTPQCKYLDLGNPTSDLQDLLPTVPEAHAHAAFRFQWRLAMDLVNFEKADIASLLTSYGAGFRLGPGSHIPALALAPSRLKLDPRGKKRLAAATKYAELLAHGVDLIICPAPGTMTEGAPRATAWLIRQLARRRGGSHRMHIGSAKPHASERVALLNIPSQPACPTGSLRQLEPELQSVLRDEPFPVSNVCPKTSPDLPHEPSPDTVGPFTTEELIPAGCWQQVEDHGDKIVGLCKRSRRAAASSNSSGIKASLHHRPARLVFEEHEALNPCGRGRRWLKRPDADLWDELRPSSRSFPPRLVSDSRTLPGAHLKLNGKKFWADSIRFGMRDLQMAGWTVTGFPVPHEVLDDRRAVLWYPHGGAVKHADHFLALATKDEKMRFCSPGSKTPIVWPQRCDPLNVVLQHDKPRLTIDKSLEQGREPFAVKAYNSYIDLADEAKLGVRVTMIRVSTFSRSIAIRVQVVGPDDVEVGKFDLKSFFRTHDRELLGAALCGSITELGYRTSWCVDFGETDAPDHTGRRSNGTCLFVRVEFERLDAAYPSKDKRILEWVARRTALFEASGEHHRERWRYTALASIYFFVDDAGLDAFKDQLYDRHGPIMELCVDKHGVESRRPLLRSRMYYAAALSIVQSYGDATPEDKQSPMGSYVLFLGVGLDVPSQRRLLDRDKRDRYTADIQELQSGSPLPNGTTAAPFDSCNSLVHKLLHASDVIPLGRQHLFHLREALKTPNELAWKAVIVTKHATTELEWWVYQLAKSDDFGLPLASRSEFPPMGDDANIVVYADASRSLDDLAGSGWGAWTILNQDEFLYIHGRWTAQEVRDHSINVLESKVRDMAAFTFVEYARASGLAATHVTSFSDNRTAEANAEYGRTGTAMLNAIMRERQEFAVELGIHIANHRVASIDNDIADLLSRGDIYEALRFPRAVPGMSIVRLEVDPSLRRFPLA